MSVGRQRRFSLASEDAPKPATRASSASCPDEEVFVAMRDGVRLASDLYLPRGTGRFPAILTRTPYDKRAEWGMLDRLAPAFNERGYALVVQDTRGKNRSEGATSAFTAEALDGYDTVEWLAECSWCDGQVGMWGDSYCGFTQWAAAAAAPPSLKAIVPMNISARIGEWMYRQGVFELALAVPWAASTWLGRELLEIEPWDVDWSVRPLRDLLPALLEGRDSASLARWRAAAEDDSLWSTGIYGHRDPLHNQGLPALHIGGWWDLFRHGQVSDWRRAGGPDRHRWLIMDATDHGLFEWSADPRGLPPREWWGTDEACERVLSTLRPQFEFYDTVLRGVDMPRPAAVRWQLTHAGWRQSDRWPPQGSGAVSIHLTGNPAGAGEAGGLSLDDDVRPALAAWLHDPGDLVPTREPSGFMLLAAPPADGPSLGRSDVLSFGSEPLTDALDLCGPVRVELELESSAASAHVVARLLDVEPEGSERRICDGAARVATGSGPAAASIELGDVGYRVLDGHRLQLQICSSDYPRYLPHPGTEDDPWDAVSGSVSEQRMQVGGASGARVVVTALTPSAGERALRSGAST